MGNLLDSNRSFPAHPSDEILEEYGFHRLSEALVAQVEEHLLVCHHCQDAVVETDQFVEALKRASRQPPSQRNALPNPPLDGQHGSGAGRETS